MTTEGTAVALTDGVVLVNGTPRLTQVGLVSATIEAEGIAVAILLDGVSIAKVGTTEVDNVLATTDVGTNGGTKLGLTWAG